LGLRLINFYFKITYKKNDEFSLKWPDGGIV
jgi:hypothetical protein